MIRILKKILLLLLIFLSCHPTKKSSANIPEQSGSGNDFSITPLSDFGDLGYRAIEDQRLALDVEYGVSLAQAAELKEYTDAGVLKKKYTLKWDAFYSNQESVSLVTVGKIKFQKIAGESDFTRSFILKGNILEPLKKDTTLVLALKIYRQTPSTVRSQTTKAQLLTDRQLIKIYTHHILGKAAEFKLSQQKNAVRLSAQGIPAQPLLIQKSGLEAEVYLSASENSKIGDELSYSGFKIEQGLPAATFVNFVMLDPHSSPLSLHGIGIDYGTKLLSLDDQLEFSMHVKKDQIPFFLIYLGDKYGQFIHIKVNLQPRL